MVERRAGRVVALQANYCLVVLDRPGPDGQQRLLCTRRTRLGKSGQRICVGDRVEVDGIDWPSARAAISALEPRSSLLERPAVANVSRVVVVLAVREPTLDPLLLTRFLVTAEATGQSVQLVLTKADLLPASELEAWCERVTGWGYPVHAISTLTGQGLGALRASLVESGIAVLCGPSGVGKSSLLNALLPNLELRVGNVSGRLQRGRHTTRHVELFSLSPTALLADSPGFNRPDLPDDPGVLSQAFPELRHRLAETSCRFSNCRHQGDPGCAMGSDWDRHALYGQCLCEVEQRAEALAMAGQRLAGLRQRGSRLEPRLDPQLRRESRRRRRQELENDLSAGLSLPDPAD